MKSIWVLASVWIGVVVWGQQAPQVVPAKAALQSIVPEAITNPQKAAILGGQNLLLLNLISHSLYLPILTR